MLKIRRALISVWDKRNLIEFAKKLVEFNVEIISTGKTTQLLRKNSIPVKGVISLTSFPEILSGRVKTLHPKIFGGILANKKNPLHLEEVKSLDLPLIDMVVVNFYPFPEKRGEKLGLDEMLEYIDIGGPALLRAAAKNYKNVAAVSSPLQYKPLIEELEKNRGSISEETLRQLAHDIFYLTREYDSHIYSYLKGKELLTLDFEKALALRYGENPHQRAALYRLVSGGNLHFTQLKGKELSFNNLLDLDTAYAMVREFLEPAAAIVKHASICGCAVDKKLVSAYKKAYATDPLSSFGGIIGLNRKVDHQTARAILTSDFKECIIAPGYFKEALRLLAAKKNLRLIEADFSHSYDFKDIKASVFGYLIQERDSPTLGKDNLKVVTRKKPTAQQLKDLVFALKVVKYVKSNAVVVAKDNCALGIGGGQPSRVGSVKIALEKRGRAFRGAVLASDGFFPQEDSLKIAYKKGIRAIIQPGGSIKDEALIKFANKARIAMLFSNIRHFRH